MDLDKFEFLNKQLDYVTLVIKALKISYSTLDSGIDPINKCSPLNIWQKY